MCMYIDYLVTTFYIVMTRNCYIKTVLEIHSQLKYISGQSTYLYLLRRENKDLALN